MVFIKLYDFFCAVNEQTLIRPTTDMHNIQIDSRGHIIVSIKNIPESPQDNKKEVSYFLKKPPWFCFEQIIIS